MSVKLEKVRKAIFAKLNVSGVTDAGATGVYHKAAPSPDADRYVLIFDRKAYANEETWGGSIAQEKMDWLIKTVVQEGTPTLGQIALAEQILAACEVALSGAWSVDGVTVVEAKRVVDLVSQQEVVAGSTTREHRGFLFRTIVE
jgi:hypothetical protein